MYEVIVSTQCLGRGYGTYNAINVPFDGCYKDKMDAVKACDDQFKTYYRESEGDLYYKDNNKFKIQKKRSSYIVIIEGEIREVDEKQEQMINLYKKMEKDFKN